MKRRKQPHSLEERFSPSEPCFCGVYRSFCKRPGCWTVQEAARAVAAGYGKHNDAGALAGSNVRRSFARVLRLRGNACLSGVRAKRLLLFSKRALRAARHGVRAARVPVLPSRANGAGANLPCRAGAGLEVAGRTGTGQTMAAAYPPLNRLILLPSLRAPPPSLARRG